VPLPHTGGVADPRVDRLLGDALPLEVVGAAAPHVDEQLRPRLHPSFLDDPLGLRAEVGAVPGPRQHVDGARGPLAIGPLEVRPQCLEDRHDPPAAARVVLDLLLMDREPGVLPVHVLPLQCLCLAGKADAAVPGQREDQPPVAVGARRDDPLDVLGRHVIDPVVVDLRAARHFGERIDGVA
jgi:hypothetical protein